MTTLLSLVRTKLGKGVVILKKDYIEKMLDILNDTSKFKRLGPRAQFDGTARTERSLQNMLRELNKKGEIPDEVYQDIRPTGSTRPRMYGVPKIHKEAVPLRPILSMVGSPQHATAKWLAELLKPVSLKFSKYTVKDSFEFNDIIRRSSTPETGHMCSFDIKSLFRPVRRKNSYHSSRAIQFKHRSTQ